MNAAATPSPAHVSRVDDPASARAAQPPARPADADLFPDSFPDREGAGVTHRAAEAARHWTRPRGRGRGPTGRQHLADAAIPPGVLDERARLRDIGERDAWFWLSFLERRGEGLRALLVALRFKPRAGDRGEHVRAALVNTAALALALIDAYDRDEAALAPASRREIDGPAYGMQPAAEAPSAP